MCTRLIFATLIGFLLCSLATVETTELLRLADDTSNDFSLPIVRQMTLTTAVSQSRDSRPKTVQTTSGCEWSNFSAQTSGSSFTPKEILNNLRVIRT
jgi:hypothetical protein